MEVQHNENLNTHAVIGGNKIRAFGISDNAEFITMLSEGLYSDKMMAVVREILCNSHDAHVSNDCLDTPIQITLSMDKMVIKDSGKGIPDSAINAIYCVYGNSTKTHNGKENGGFGLGSKAPFAYTNHFTVTSKHNGTKTVYAVSRGSSETDGKPDMREMACVSCDDSGLEVSLPVKNSFDSQSFNNIIRQVVLFGEMNVELNGEKIDTLEFSGITEKFMLVNRSTYPFLRDRRTTSKIYLRYGTVIYPITPEADFIEQYKSIESLINVTNNNDDRIFVIQAEPNTIAITPSRESLSMTARTKETITNLFKEIVANFNDKILTAYKELVNDYIPHYKQHEHSRLRTALTNENFNRNSTFIQPFLRKPIDTPYDLLKLCMVLAGVHCNPNSVQLTIEKGIRHSILLSALLKHDPERTPWYKAIQNLNIRDNSSANKELIYETWNRVTISEFICKLSTEAKEYLRLSTSGSDRKAKNRLYKLSDILSEKLEKEFIEDKIIIVGYNREDIVEADRNCASIEDTYLALCVSRKKGISDAIIAELEELGIEHIDARLEIVKKAPNPYYIKRPKGYVKLSCAVTERSVYNPDMLCLTTSPRIERPLQVFVERTLDYKRVISKLELVSVADITTLLPHAAIVSNMNTYNSLIKKGSFDGYDALISRIKFVFETQPEFLQMMHNHYQRNNSGIIQSLKRLIPYDTVVENLFKDNPITNPFVISAYNLYRSLAHRGNVGAKCHDLIDRVTKAIKSYKETDKLTVSLSSNPLLVSLNIDVIYRSCQQKSPHAYDQLKLLHIALG